MAAGVFSLGGSRGELATVTLAAPRGLVIGLGGGALTNLLANLVPTCALTAVELDPAVVDVARASFGLREACLEVRIGDGLSLAVHDGDAAVASPLSFATGSFSFLILDVDSKDSTVGT
jgi:spermidine synthase